MYEKKGCDRQPGDEYADRSDEPVKERSELSIAQSGGEEDQEPDLGMIINLEYPDEQDVDSCQDPPV